MFWMIPDAPVTIALPKRGVLGVAGPGDVPRAAGRWLVAQIAALHSPNDVQICVLTYASEQVSWQWARWLPHCQPAEGVAPVDACGGKLRTHRGAAGARDASLPGWRDTGTR